MASSWPARCLARRPGRPLARSGEAELSLSLSLVPTSKAEPLNSEQHNRPPGRTNKTNLQLVEFLAISSSSCSWPARVARESHRNTREARPPLRGGAQIYRPPIQFARVSRAHHDGRPASGRRPAAGEKVGGSRTRLAGAVRERASALRAGRRAASPPREQLDTLAPPCAIARPARKSICFNARRSAGGALL